MKLQLIVTFTNKKSLQNVIKHIVDKFDNILNNKIYVLSTSGEKLICSYSIQLDGRIQFLPDSILVHRKKDTNTLYSINALNYIVKRMNNGILDKTLQIPWENYEDCLLIIDNGELKKINTELSEIINIKK
ncbi:MAG: hypothetical protein H8E98_04040 [Bacteroidetes bacterium]|nr:hypothetical protein [Bacteroidota bacterium]